MDIILHGTEKKEDLFLKPFVLFYLAEKKYIFSTVNIIKPDEDKSGANPDYFIEEPKIVVEVKEVYPPNKKYRNELWKQTCNRIAGKIKKRMAEFGIDGYYEIPVSSYWGIKKSNKKAEEDYITKTIEGINNSKYVKISNKETGVHFTDQGHFFGFSSNANKNEIQISLNRVLPNANIQLGKFVHATKRILLLINYIPNPLWKLTGFKLYKDVISKIERNIITNIDEIWIQFGRDGDEKHEQLFP